ncbi:hypothetical protein BG32_14775, partial [Mesotoga sp. HF07.pep.5.2.highcov]
MVIKHEQSFPQQAIAVLVTSTFGSRGNCFLDYPYYSVSLLEFFQSFPIWRQANLCGWYNFTKLFKSSDYVDSLMITLVFAVFVVIIGLTVGMLLSVLLNQKLRGLQFYRTLFIWTYA